MWPVRNKTIIGLKLMTSSTYNNHHHHVRNKTIIGLKLTTTIYYIQQQPR